MKYNWIDEYCLSKKGVIKDYKPEWDATRYMIKDKMFVLRCGDKEGKPIITVKLEPAHGEFLRQEFKDIIPGYYMNKQHWNSLYLDGDVPDEIVEDMLDRSYNLVLASLSKKLQEEFAEQD
jgi:predicted DNA-binding protein (MmcQ/YjbR family)